MAAGPTAAWTEFRSRYVLTAVVLVSAGIVAGLEDSAARLSFVILTAAVAVATLHYDGFIGLVLGLAAAAIHIGVKRVTGSWTSESLALIVTETGVLIVLAWVVGLLGEHQRSSVRRLSRAAPGTLVPAHGSLGLLTGVPAQFRVGEEIARRRMSGEPLSLMLLTTDPVTGLDEELVVAADRAVARHLETLLRDTDVPFELSEGVFGALLPVTDVAEGWALAGPLVESAAAATFADRVTETRRVVGDCLDVRVCVLAVDDTVTDARSLIDHGLTQLGVPGASGVAA